MVVHDGNADIHPQYTRWHLRAFCACNLYHFLQKQRHAGAWDKCGLQWGDKDSQEMVTKVAREPTSAGPPRAGIWTDGRYKHNRLNVLWSCRFAVFFFVWAAGVVGIGVGVGVVVVVVVAITVVITVVVIVVAAFGAAVHPYSRQVIYSFRLL